MFASTVLQRRILGESNVINTLTSIGCLNVADISKQKKTQNNVALSP